MASLYEVLSHLPGDIGVIGVQLGVWIMVKIMENVMGLHGMILESQK